MSKATQFQEMVDLLEAQHIDKLAIVSKQAFDEVIKPFCDKYFLRFVANGFGGYKFYCTEFTPRWFITEYVGKLFFSRKEGVEIDINSLPKKISDVMSVRIFFGRHALAYGWETYEPEMKLTKIQLELIQELIFELKPELIQLGIKLGIKPVGAGGKVPQGTYNKKGVNSDQIGLN